MPYDTPGPATSLAAHNSATGSRSNVTRSSPPFGNLNRSRKYRPSRVSSARMLGFDQHVPAPAILDPLNRTRSGSNDRNPGTGRDRRSRCSHVVADVARFAVAASVVPLKTTFARRTFGGYGGVTRPSSSCFTNPRVVVRHGAPHGVMHRHARLNQHAPAFRAPTRATRHLAEELKAALGRAKVRQIDANVGIDHADERDIRKV